MALSSYQRGLSNITLNRGCDGHRGLRPSSHGRKKPPQRSAKENAHCIAPEVWYDESKILQQNRALIVIEQRPGSGYRHAVTTKEVRDRVAELGCLQSTTLERVQLSQMSNKRYMDPCYGMQWGNTVYLYPIEENLEEIYTRRPDNQTRIETERYGAQWEERKDEWVLQWISAQNVRDFYLYNVLTHEVGHLVDIHNTTYEARERFANAFAYAHGDRLYSAAQGQREVVKRHHRK